MSVAFFIGRRFRRVNQAASLKQLLDQVVGYQPSGKFPPGKSGGLIEAHRRHSGAMRFRNPCCL